jgi:hypothetical protein
LAKELSSGNCDHGGRLAKTMPDRPLIVLPTPAAASRGTARGAAVRLIFRAGRDRGSGLVQISRHYRRISIRGRLNSGLQPLGRFRRK